MANDNQSNLWTRRLGQLGVDTSTTPLTPPHQPRAVFTDQPGSSYTAEQLKNFRPVPVDYKTDTGEAALYGLARGGTLGGVDRLVGLGNYLGDQVASSESSGLKPTPNVYKNSRQEYLDNEAKATEDHEWAHTLGELAGGLVPTIATAGATGPVIQAGVLGGVSGAMNNPSDDPKELAKSGAWGAATSAVGQHVLGKVLSPSEALHNQARGLPAAMERVNPTAGKEADETLAAARQQLKLDKKFADAARNDAVTANRMATDKLDALTPAPPDVYRTLDTVRQVSADDFRNAIDSTELPVNAKRAKAVLDDWLNDLRDKDLMDTVPTSETEVEDRIPAAEVHKFVRNTRLDPDKAPAAPIAEQVWKNHLKTVDEAASSTAKKMRQQASLAPTLPSSTPTSVLRNLLADRAEKAPEAVNRLRNDDATDRALVTMRKVFQNRVNAGEHPTPTVGHGMDIPILGGLASLAGGHPGIAGLAGLAHVAKKYGDAPLHALNDVVLVPIMQAIDKGKPWGEILRIALERGFPQSIARAMYEKKASLDAVPKEVVKEGRDLLGMPGTPAVNSQGQKK